MRLRLIAAALLLTACQMALPEKPTGTSAPNPITAGQISVTALDAPAATDPLAAQEPTPAAAPDAKPVKTLEPQAAPTPTAPPAPETPAPVTTVASAAQKACEKAGGAWVFAGKTGTRICQTPLRDGGKACSRDSDCEGQCLARSRSCAPYSPLFGCNDILQDNGQRVSLCIE